MGVATIKKPDRALAVYRCVLATLVCALLFLDLLFYGAMNMVSWIGGPLAGVTSVLLTTSLGFVLWILPLKTTWTRVFLTLAALLVWPFATLAVYQWADPIQARMYSQDAERLAKSYIGGPLPPGCKADLPYRARPGVDIHCGTTDVAAYLRKNLGKDWVEHKKPEGPKFTRAVGGHEQVIAVFGNGGSTFSVW